MNDGIEGTIQINILMKRKFHFNKILLDINNGLIRSFIIF